MTDAERVLLNEKINTLFEIIESKNNFEKKEKELKKELVSMLEKEDMTCFEGNEHKLSLVYKDTYKYSDEPGMIKWLKDNGYSNYIEVSESIKKPLLNKELGTSTVLNEGLNSMFNKSRACAVTIK